MTSSGEHWKSMGYSKWNSDLYSYIKIHLIKQKYCKQTNLVFFLLKVQKCSSQMRLNRGVNSEKCSFQFWQMQKRDTKIYTHFLNRIRTEHCAKTKRNIYIEFERLNFSLKSDIKCAKYCEIPYKLHYISAK